MTADAARVPPRRLLSGAALGLAVTGRDGGRTPGQETGDTLVTRPMVRGGPAILSTVMGAVALTRTRVRTRNP